jgi:hypothetical protein
MTIAEAHRRYHSINIDMLINDAFAGSKETIEQFNREQLEAGKLSTGEDIGEYGGWYREWRIGMGLQVDYVDLKVTGKFHNSIYVKREGNEYEIFSTDTASKVQALIYGGNGVRKGGFGEEIFGLTDENKLTVKGLTRDTLIEIIEQVMNI